MYSMESYRRDMDHGKLHWWDCIAYQCNLGKMYTKHALCSGCISNSAVDRIKLLEVFLLGDF